jgi:curli biogenesis system outer membrane secretion channel CsgG
MEWRRTVSYGAALLLGSTILVMGGCSESLMGKSQDLLTRGMKTLEPQGDTLLTQGPKKRIGVLPFQVITKTYSMPGVDQVTAELLTTSLFKTGQFIVVERGRLDKVMTEQGLGMTGAVDSQTAVSVGKVLGLQAIVTGAITQMGFEERTGAYAALGGKQRVAGVRLDMRVIDTATARIVMADTGSGDASVLSTSIRGVQVGSKPQDSEMLEKALRSAIENVTQKIVGQMGKVPWSGRIARVSKDQMYVNAGMDLGLQPGDRLGVYRTGTEIKDPTTGELLGMEETLIGQVLITDVRDRLSVATVGSGTGFRENDIVRLMGR